MCGMKLLSLLHSLLLFVEVMTEGVKIVLRQFNASNDDGVAFTLELKVWQREEGAISWFFTGLRTKGGAMEESFGKAKSSPTQHP